MSPGEQCCPWLESMFHTEKGRMDKSREVGIRDVISELVTILSSLGCNVHIQDEKWISRVLVMTHDIKLQPPFDWSKLRWTISDDLFHRIPASGMGQMCGQSLLSIGGSAHIGDMVPDSVQPLFSPFIFLLRKFIHEQDPRPLSFPPHSTVFKGLDFDVFSGWRTSYKKIPVRYVILCRAIFCKSLFFTLQNAIFVRI